MELLKTIDELRKSVDDIGKEHAPPSGRLGIFNCVVYQGDKELSYSSLKETGGNFSDNGNWFGFSLNHSFRAGEISEFFDGEDVNISFKRKHFMSAVFDRSEHHIEWVITTKKFILYVYVTVEG
jgi:hypothetical protein